jgi:hypothetical protein
VPIVFERELYLELVKFARAEGISVSALVRMLVEEYLASKKKASSGSQNPGVDPVIKMDLEDLEEELDRLVETVRGIEVDLQRYGEKAPRLHMRITGAENTLKKLRARYRAVRGLPGSERVAVKLLEVASRIKQLKKAVR